jgi:altronate dehydratase
LTANPAVGRSFDRLVAGGARCIFEETGELIGCEEHLRGRAATSELGAELAARVVKAARYYEELGHASIAPGNLVGGLTTIEEKSIGAYAKSGSSTISGVIEPGELPAAGGLYLLDVVPDGSPRFGYPNINDTTEVVELIACGAHVILFTTGRGSVVGSVISPVIKVCANPDTYRRMSDDMDVDAGRILLGEASLDEVGAEIFDLVVATASGAATRSEALGHQEFQLGYKLFRSLEPSCLAVSPEVGRAAAFHIPGPAFRTTRSWRVTRRKAKKKEAGAPVLAASSLRPEAPAPASVLLVEEPTWARALGTGNVLGV